MPHPAYETIWKVIREAGGTSDETTRELFEALDAAGFIVIRDPNKDPGRAPDPFVDAAERAALGLP